MTDIYYLRRVPVVSIEDYFNHFLPSLPGSLDLDHIVRTLSSPQAGQEQALLDTSTPCWRTHHTSFKDPSNCDRPRSISSLEDISQAVTSACVEYDPSLRPTSFLIPCLGEDKLKGDLCSPSKPDAIHAGTDIGEHLAGELERKTLWWEHAAVLYGFKERNSDVDIFVNMSKMMWDLMQKLSSDPTCRFVRGCTVEDISARFWYADHSVMLVTERIDFHKDYRMLASFFARIGFASSAQLGWEPGIERISSDAFRIHVEDKSYHTVRYLENSDAEKVFGRCVRIWEATDEATDETACIKDYWLDDDRPSEAEVLGGISTAISEHPWEAEVEDPRPRLSIEARQAYFVRILASDVVHVDGSNDNKQQTHKYDFTQVSQQFSLVDLEPEEGTWSSDPDAAPEYFFHGVTPLFMVHSIASKSHHRVVMDRGTVLYAVKKSSDVFTACADVTYALFLLKCVKRGHRDISPGNVLVFPTAEGGVRGVLADFEYSKHFNDTSTHPMRTGTPNYMAVEVQKGGFMGPPPQTYVPRSSNSQPVWTFCAAHDVESVWWIFVWVLFRHFVRSPLPALPQEDSSLLSEKTNIHLEIYHKIFSGPFSSRNHQGRAEFLQGVDASNAVYALSRYWPEKLLKLVCWDLPQQILDVYTQAKTSRNTPTELYTNVMAVCNLAAEVKGDLETIPLTI